MPQQVSLIIAKAEKICQHRFDLLGYTDLDYGAKIDWHLDAVNRKRAPMKPFHQVAYLDFQEVGDAKVTWELNRHQQLVTLAKAYRLTGDPKFTAELWQQWKDWHAQNPYPIGINWASSLEVAFRSLSWLWVYFLLADAEVFPIWFREEWIKALALSGRHIGRYLSTYFSPNTHLLGEGVALFFIGTLCPEIQQASTWKERGWRIIVEEAKRQIRPDGFHFEQSLYYHVYALDFFLHARMLAARNDIFIPAEFDRTVESMLNALALVVGAGTPCSFGDDDGGRLFDPQRNHTQHLLDPLAAGAVLFQRGEFKALVGEVPEEMIWLLGIGALDDFDNLRPERSALRSSALTNSGLYIMADAETQTQLLVDAGPQGAASAGHGHADALSVCAAQDGTPLLIDPGTRVYVGDGPERDSFRGTPAHNTMSVNGCDQAIPSGPFAWTNLPNVTVDCWVAGKTFDFFAGHHDGYARLTNPVVHRRDVFFRKGKFWLVRDRAQGSGTHELAIRWHLPPDFVQDGDWFTRGDRGIGFLAAERHGWNVLFEKGMWSPAYGQEQPAPIVSFCATAALPQSFVTLVVPRLHSQQELGLFRRLETGKTTVVAYHYMRDQEETYFIFAEGNESWQVENFASDAQFLCMSVRRQDSVRELMFCNGKYVEIMGRAIVSSAELVQRCELIQGESGVQTFSSAHAGTLVQQALGDFAFTDSKRTSFTASERGR